MVNSKRLLNSLYQENTQLKSKIQSLEQSSKTIDTLQLELQTLAEENHRLEVLLQRRNSEMHNLKSPTPRSTTTRSTGWKTQTSDPRERQKSDSETRRSAAELEKEVERLSEELAWHSKLHLFAEKERLRLLDLLEFSGNEGKIVGKEIVGLRQKVSMFSLRSWESEGKCLV